MSADDQSTWKWCTGKSHHVTDVEEAIALAERFKQEGRYDWFRGQVKPWPPLSSLTRAQMRNPDWEFEFTPKFKRYYEFLKNNSELEPLAHDRDALFAVAQHYGIPTHTLISRRNLRLPGILLAIRALRSRVKKAVSIV